MTLNEYFAQRGFDKDKGLKQYDAFETPIPIGYTKGCTRHLVKALSRPEIKIQPQLGHLYARPQYEQAVQAMMDIYQTHLAHDLLQNVFERDIPPITGSEDCDQIPMEVVHEILTRFYPSDYNWLHDRDGAWPTQRGYVDPVQHSAPMRRLLQDAGIRERAFHIQMWENERDDDEEYYG